MRSLLFVLVCALLIEDAEQLETHVKHYPPFGSRSEGVRREDGRYVKRSPFEISFEAFPRTPMVGDVVYIQASTKNITDEPFRYEFYRVGRIAYTRHEGILGTDPFLGSDFFAMRWDFLLGNDSFIQEIVTVKKNVSTVPDDGHAETMEESWINIKLPGTVSQSVLRELLMPPRITVTPRPGGTALQRHMATLRRQKILQPGGTMLSGPDYFMAPFPDDYNEQFWDSLADEERMTFTFGAGLRIINEKLSNTVDWWNMTCSMEMKIIPRPKEELDLIEKWWYDKTKNFENIWSVDSPKPAEWREFEEKLTPGTLRNYVRMIRTLLEMMPDENEGKRQEMFDEMLKWIDELHPLEKEGLTKHAYEIVMNRIGLREEITLPAVGD